MGGFGIGVSLRRLENVPAAGCKDVYDATRALLVETWRGRLPENFRDAAIEWVDSGFDSLMTIGTFYNDRLEEEDPAEPAEEVLFHFYENADWPLALCEHWLRLTMISVREDWEKQLAKLGYAIEGDYLAPSNDRFFVEGDRIGHPEADGVSWLLPDSDFAEYEELDAQTMKLVEAAKKTCACPWCAKS